MQVDSCCFSTTECGSWSCLCQTYCWMLRYILAPTPLGDPKTCQAWLPQEQIRPLVGPSETEILEALCNSVASEAEFFVRQGKTSRFDRMPGCWIFGVFFLWKWGKPVKIWLDTGLLHTGLPVATMWKEEAPKFDGNSEREDSSSDMQKAGSPTNWNWKFQGECIDW